MSRLLLCLLLCLPGVAAAETTPSCKSSQSCMTEGIHAMVEGEYDLAIRAFQRGHVKRPGPSFLYHIALCHGRSGRHSSAIEFLDWTLTYKLPQELRRRAHARRKAYLLVLRAQTLLEERPPLAPVRSPAPASSRLDIDDFDIPRRSPQG